MTLRNHPAIVCAILLGSMVYAMLYLAYWGMAPNYSFDENWHTVFATLSPAWRAFLSMSDDTHPFLYYLLLRPFMWLGGDAWFARLLSIIPTLLTIPLWYALLRKLRISTGVALTFTVMLAVSFPFLDMGVMVRSYSLTVFMLLGALWFWADMVPGSLGRPSRWSSFLSLTLFGLAFLCLYAAGFVAAAVIGGTLLVMIASPALRSQILLNWRQHGGWTEWMLFLILHLIGVAWFVIGLRDALDTVIPGHVRAYVLTDGQSIIEFLLQGLRQELSLFTALPLQRPWVLDAGWLLILATAVWQFVRSLRAGNAIAAVVAISPILLTIILALIALLKHYPFGGELRHQYVLFPLLLLLLALLVDSLWRAIHSNAVRLVIAVLLVAAMLSISSKTLRVHTMMGEAPAAPLWGEEFSLLFDQGGELPVIIPQYTFYSAFINRWTHGIRYQDGFYCDASDCHPSTQGWRALIERRPDIQQYRVNVQGGKDITLLAFRWWTFPVLPNDEFFRGLSNSLRAIDAHGARLFSQSDDPERGNGEPALRADAAAHGFRLTEFLVTDKGIIWSVEHATTDPGPVTAQ